MLGAQCSWKLDSSTAMRSCLGSSAPEPASTASSTGQPMLPLALTRRPAARRIDSSIPVVVVLPLVPVTTSQSRGSPPARSSRQANSTSPITSIPAASAAASSGFVGGMPAEVITKSVPAGGVSRSPAKVTSPGICASSAGAGRLEVTTTVAPVPARYRTTGSPVTPTPAASTRSPGPGSTAPVTSTTGEGEPFGIEQAEAERGRHRGQQPEPHHHRRLGPAGQLEMMMERSHFEHPHMTGLEDRDLDHHGQHLDHEEAGDHHQQQLGLGQDRQAGDQPAKGERTGVA